jgi:hypothetical protein
MAASVGSQRACAANAGHAPTDIPPDVMDAEQLVSFSRGGPSWLAAEPAAAIPARGE